MSDNKNDNIIPFPGEFKKNESVDKTVNNNVVLVPNNATAFLSLIKERLDLSDYEHVLCAILDYDYFLELDLDLQMLVLQYFSYRP